MMAVAWILIILTANGAPAAETHNMEEMIYRANQAYGEGRYQEAISGYLKVIENGQVNGHLYYNLANAYLRENNLGRAVLFYERARLLIPRDGDLQFNLRYALDQTRDAIANSQDFLGQTFFWLDGVTLEEMFWVFALLNLLLWTLLVVRVFHRPEWTYYTFLLLLALWLISGLSYGAKWYQVSTDDRCVVLPQEVTVRAGPASEDTVLFKLHQGAVVRAERSEQGWTLIRLPDSNRGWLESEAVERVLMP